MGEEGELDGGEDVSGYREVGVVDLDSELVLDLGVGLSRGCYLAVMDFDVIAGTPPYLGYSFGTDCEPGGYWCPLDTDLADPDSLVDDAGPGAD